MILCGQGFYIRMNTFVKTLTVSAPEQLRCERITVGRPVGGVPNLSSGIKTFDGLGDVPGIEELKLGEIGINTQDGRLYIKRAYDGVETIVGVVQVVAVVTVQPLHLMHTFIRQTERLEQSVVRMMQVTYYSMIQIQTLRHEFKYI